MAGILDHTLPKQEYGTRAELAASYDEVDASRRRLAIDQNEWLQEKYSRL